MPVKVKRTKQKQKQRQSQSVVVHLHTGRKAPAKRVARRNTRGGASGGGGSGNYVAYSSPIINDPYIPQQFQQIPTITMPQNAIENRPPPNTTPLIEYIPPTTLQTATQNTRPLVDAIRQDISSGASVMTEMTPLSIDTTRPKPRMEMPPATRAPARMSLLDELKMVQKKKAERASLGDINIGSSIARSKVTPLEVAIQQEVSRRSSRASTPSQMRSPGSPGDFYGENPMSLSQFTSSRRGSGTFESGHNVPPNTQVPSTTRAYNTGRKDLSAEDKKIYDANMRKENKSKKAGVKAFEQQKMGTG